MHLTPIPFHLEIPLFPLPNCVLFPGVVQPLHIFEPRYREMLRAAIAAAAEGAVADESPLGHKPLLTMALLQAGWEKDYHGVPAIHPVLCAGRVIAHELLPDGKYNLLLQGVSRCRVLAERKCMGPWGVYRMARLEEVGERKMTESHEKLQRRVLRQLFEKSPLKDLTVTPELTPLFDDAVPTSRLIDALAFSMVQDVAAKQRLLEEADVGVRGELLLRELVALAGRMPAAASDSEWPPQINMN